VRSTPDKGSVFTLYLPQTYMGTPAVAPAALPDRPPTAIPGQGNDPVQAVSLDDRHRIQPGDPVLLIVEDDPHHIASIGELAREVGFKLLVANRGSEALALAREYRPTAVSLDLFLPDMLGWTLLSQLKQDPSIRHLPVQIVSSDEELHHGLARGAFACLNKPADSEVLRAALKRLLEYGASAPRRLLLVEDDAGERLAIATLLGHDDIEIVSVDHGAAALQALQAEPFDCMVLDLHLPDTSGFDLLTRLREDEALGTLPVVVFTGKELSPDEDAHLRTLARSVVVKGVESPERLLDETALFLHRDVSRLPADKQALLERLLRSDDSLKGRQVLVVDDDVRNIFALSSVLERHGMRVLTAGTGREAIEILAHTPDVAIVLMDIMMPEMDGYETMRVIRQNPRFRRLPIVALTAKAMKGDREKCLDAGASDYLAKPVNTDQLLFALRTWLHR
jgi:hypothetical protein